MSREINNGAETSGDQQGKPQLHRHNFLDLPGEIRNEIYLLVAGYQIQKSDPRASVIMHAVKLWDHKERPWFCMKDNPHLNILQPGLFLACKQIRLEGLPFFYQKRIFSFALEQRDHRNLHQFSTLGVSTWFQAIGDLGQQNLRCIKFHNSPTLDNFRYQEWVHRKLSEEATVTYVAGRYRNMLQLWGVAGSHHARNTDKVPVIVTKVGIRTFLENWREGGIRSQLMS